MSNKFDPKEIRENGPYNEYGTRYPVPGFRNLLWNIEANNLPPLKTPRFKAYNAWAKAHNEKEIAEDEQKVPGYYFRGVIGKNSPLFAENLCGGTFTIEPGVSYGIGSHPTNEIYIVISGEGEFYNYDRCVHAKPGTWIMIRPFDVHGIRNTSKTIPLEIIWFWWNEDHEMPNWDCGGLPVMPKECWQNKENPDVKPLRQPHDLKGDDRFIYLAKGANHGKD